MPDTLIKKADMAAAFFCYGIESSICGYSLPVPDWALLLWHHTLLRVYLCCNRSNVDGHADGPHVSVFAHSYAVPRGDTGIAFFLF